MDALRRYGAMLGRWFRARWGYPNAISKEEGRHLCVTYRVIFDKNMVMQHVDEKPSRRSGNRMFDQSVLTLFKGLITNHVQLPAPPEEVADRYLGMVEITMTGNENEDSAQCRW